VGLFLHRHRRKNTTTKTKTKPSHRGRRRKGPSQKYNKSQSWVLSHDGTGDCSSFFPKRVEGNPTLPSYRMRTSVRWIQDYKKTCERWIGLPYIDFSGRMSPSKVALWKCHPAQAVASITSTIYSRITRVMIKRHGTRFTFKLQPEILKVAATYALTQNNFVMNRFYGIYRKKNSAKPIQCVISKFVRNMDVDQRFVYSQVLSQTHWLTHRSERPRVKSEKNIYNDDDMMDRFSFENETPCQCYETYSCLYGSLCTTEFPRIKEFRYRPEPTLKTQLRGGRVVIGKPVRLAKRLRKPTET
jgi:hypothetical protein